MTRRALIEKGDEETPQLCSSSLSECEADG